MLPCGSNDLWLLYHTFLLERNVECDVVHCHDSVQGVGHWGKRAYGYWFALTEQRALVGDHIIILTVLDLCGQHE